MSIEEYIWYEKYRPKTINEMSLPVLHKKSFEKYIEDKEIPHLLLSGIQGSGKSTILFILSESIPCTKIILNGSAVNIDLVRTTITDFARSQTVKGKIKMVLINEADKIKTDALGALHDVMEAYSKNCRFILTCNYLDKIDKPIKSRCTIFTFSQFPKKRLVRLLGNILIKENIPEVQEEELISLVDRYYPDVRSVINNLQNACISGVFNVKSIGTLQIDPIKLKQLLLEGKLGSLREEIQRADNYEFIYRWLFYNFLPEVKKDLQARVAKAILDFEARDNVVADREIQLVGCFIGLMYILGINFDWYK